MVQVRPETTGPAVQMGRPVVQGVPVGRAGQAPREVQGVPIEAGQPYHPPPGDPPLMQASVVRVPGSPQVGEQQPELLFVRAPSPQVMGYRGDHIVLERHRLAYSVEQDTTCLQVGTIYACCCPCGLCVGCALWTMNKDASGPRRVWSQYALGAGVFNLACNLAATAARTLVI
mmetsp:Transcript_32228/g.87348  ORF Transcript_32228/g.87348 Transcript_32228/m.87348 type:complete len:173 (-) Transcript_32228:90-608(-)